MVEELNPADKTLEIVREYFPDALMTTASLRKIGIRLNYHPSLDPSEVDLHPGITIPTPVIYLPRPLNGFTRAFNHEEEERLIGLGLLDRVTGEPRNALAKLASLPKIDGWKWDNATIWLLAKIVENHLHEQDEYLLPRQLVWTKNTGESSRNRFVRLIAGYFGPDGLNINCIPGYEDNVGIFPVGLPEQPASPRLHLVQG